MGGSSTYDVAIIGAGAAGMFCAAETARRGRRVVVIEHARKPGEKIRISGGGCCNFTNLDARPEAYLSGNKRFCVSALKRYTQHDFIAQVDAHGIDWHEKTLGQLFCDGKSTQIVEMLLTEMGDAGAELRLGCSVDRVEARGGGFLLSTDQGAVEAGALVVACGGKSIPKMGATGFGYQIARDFGVAVTETRAGLVPFTVSEADKARFAELPGVAADVVAKAGKAKFEEAMLFTHRGLSGPAMLQVSSYWKEGEEIAVSFGDSDAIFAALRQMRAENAKWSLARALATVLPKALSRMLAEETGITSHMADLSDKRLRKVAADLSDWRLQPIGTEGYRTAEVTLGGVDPDALDSRTMQARDVPGLYFIGEVVDVTGWLGGYNFQWAWSSGWAAGQAV
ncbi:MAG: NAD(P)/FAD-dependent oxidoreductase [Pikeienuella sp.]